MCVCEQGSNLPVDIVSVVFYTPPARSAAVLSPSQPHSQGELASALGWLEEGVGGSISKRYWISVDVNSHKRYWPGIITRSLSQPPPISSPSSFSWDLSYLLLSRQSRVFNTFSREWHFILVIKYTAIWITFTQKNNILQLPLDQLVITKIMETERLLQVVIS